MYLLVYVEQASEWGGGSVYSVSYTHLDVYKRQDQNALN